MSENQFQYGTGFTSVRTHHAPGGTSSISLGWDSEEPKAPQRNQPQEELKAEDAPQAAEEEKEKEEEEEEEGKKESEIAGQRAGSQAATSVKVHAPPGGHSSISFG